MTADIGAGLPEALGQAFGTFEAIRRLARRCEDRSPDLFAAFMSVAAAAADGRDAVLRADTVPARAAEAAGSGQPAPGASPDDVADWIAAAANGLAASLNRAAGLARSPQDRRACQDAAAAAQQIHQLMAPAHDDTHAR